MVDVLRFARQRCEVSINWRSIIPSREAPQLRLVLTYVTLPLWDPVGLHVEYGRKGKPSRFVKGIIIADADPGTNATMLQTRVG